MQLSESAAENSRPVKYQGGACSYLEAAPDRVNTEAFYNRIKTVAILSICRCLIIVCLSVLNPGFLLILIRYTCTSLFFEGPTNVRGCYS